MISAILTKAATILEHGFCRHTSAASGKTGTPIGNDAAVPKVDRFCMAGAIIKAEGMNWVSGCRRSKGLEFMIRHLNGTGSGSVFNYNDEHTQDEVVAVVRQAAASAVEQGL